MSFNKFISFWIWIFLDFFTKEIIFSGNNLIINLIIFKNDWRYVDLSANNLMFILEDFGIFDPQDHLTLFLEGKIVSRQVIHSLL